MVRRFEDHGLQWRLVLSQVFFHLLANIACQKNAEISILHPNNKRKIVADALTVPTFQTPVPDVYVPWLGLLET